MLRSPVVRVGYHQPDDKIGRRTAERDLSGHSENRKRDPAVRSSTEDESGRAGYRQRSERFFPDILTDVLFAAATLLLLLG